ncbi:hypothetical protein MNV49_005300 [Pseudohyphozyma bogoriensis]|nr:hypothetical protein MNV49_005300 [Pseudohyphozyma bogoriensis]
MILDEDPETGEYQRPDHAHPLRSLFPASASASTMSLSSFPPRPPPSDHSFSPALPNLYTTHSQQQEHLLPYSFSRSGASEAYGPSSGGVHAFGERGNWFDSGPGRGKWRLVWIGVGIFFLYLL